MIKHRLYCVFAAESVQKMRGNRGKMCAQAGHAFLHATIDAMQKFPQHVQDYFGSGHAYKITLIVPTVQHLHGLQKSYATVCGTSLVTDAGFTVFSEPTTTCLGIGPISEQLIGDDLRSLKTFV
jgi:peptidyl-tRNA hydrolase